MKSWWVWTWLAEILGVALWWHCSSLWWMVLAVEVCVVGSMPPCVVKRFQTSQAHYNSAQSYIVGWFVHNIYI